MLLYIQNEFQEDSKIPLLMQERRSISNNVSGEGRLHRGRHVRPARASSSRDPGGLRDGRGKDYAKGLREEHVHQEALQINSSNVLQNFSCFFCFVR